MNKKYNSSNYYLEGYKFDKWYKKYEEKSKSHPEENTAERVKLRR